MKQYNSQRHRQARDEGGGWAPNNPLHRETHWSIIRKWILQNFPILIVSAVKLQTPGGPLPEHRSWAPLGDFCPLDPLGNIPLNENSCRATVPSTTVEHTNTRTMQLGIDENSKQLRTDDKPRPTER